MRFAFYTVCPSPHQYPLAKELVSQIGATNFRYISSRETEGERSKLGWGGALNCEWEILPGTQKEAAREWIENADILFSYIRDVDLFARRTSKGLNTFYCAERWFKPFGLGSRNWGLGSREWYLPGWLRMLVPSYRRMVKRFVKWANEDPWAKVFAIGPWAKKDFLRMGVKAEKIVDWGYFVAPSELEVEVRGEGEQRRVDDSNKRSGDRFPVGDRFPLKVLWVGRMLDWKRVGDIERAVEMVNGRGGSGNDATGVSRPRCTFTKLTGVPLAEVRKAMREHDVYVLASNAYEGWGAALNEALEEGMSAIGTFEAGASAAMLPKERLYHCGDVRELARLLALEVEERGGGGQRKLPPCSIGEWTAMRAAERLVRIFGGEL